MRCCTTIDPLWMLGQERTKTHSTRQRLSVNISPPLGTPALEWRAMSGVPCKNVVMQQTKAWALQPVVCDEMPKSKR